MGCGLLRSGWVKTALVAAGATVDGTKFDSYAISTATTHPKLAGVSADDDDDSGVAIGVGAGVGVPLFLALLYYLRRHCNNKNDGGNVVRSGKAEAGTLKASDMATASGAV